MRDRTRQLSDEVIERVNDTTTINLVTEVFYGAGGMNYATYKTEPRGYWVLVKVFEQERGEHFTSERYTAFDGSRTKALIAPATRFSAKTLASLVPDQALIATMKASVLATRAENESRRRVLTATEGT